MFSNRNFLNRSCRENQNTLFKFNFCFRIEIFQTKVVEKIKTHFFKFNFCFRIEIFQTKFVEKIKTHFLNSIFVFEYRAFYAMKWKNNVEPDRSQMKIRRMRIAWWILKAIDTRSEYVILIAFPL